jgi:PAS domain S-box-containing protein
MSSIPNGEFIDINPKFEQVTGRSRKELIGKKVTDLGFYTNEKDRIKLFKELENKGRLQGYEIEFKVKNGKIRNCEMNSEIIDIDGGHCLISVVNDITEQKQSKLALENQNNELISLGNELSKKHMLLTESERNFKNLFNKNPVSLWEEDFSVVKQMLAKKLTETSDLKQYLDENPDFVVECVSNLEILNVNDITLELLGFENKKELFSVLGKTFNERSLEGFKTQLVAVSQNKKEFSIESELVKSDGSIINVLIKLVNNSDDDDTAIVSIIDITELNRAKQKIEASEKRFRALYEKSGDAILIIKNGIFIDCNQATVDMLEYKTKNDFLKSHPSKLSPKLQPDGKNSFDKAVEMMNASLKKGTHRFEWIHTKNNGENFPVEVLLTAISTEPNNETIHCVWRDITERKKAEFTLIESERELQNSQEIAQLGSFNFNLSTQLFVGSPIFDSIVGFKAGDKKTLEIYKEIVHPDDFAMNEKMLKECIKYSKKFDREYRIFNYSTKELMWLHGFGEIIYSESGEMNFKGTIQDITERKLIELEVKKNEQKLIEVQKIANLGTYELDLMTNSIITSKIYDSILEIKKRPRNKKGWWKNLAHPEDYELSELLWQECINDCKIYNHEYRILTYNNKIKWIHSIAEVKYENGVAAKVVGTIQDITARKLIEQEVKINEQKLIEVQKIANLGTYEIDLETNNIDTSELYNSILGIKKKPKNNKGWWKSITHPDDFERSELLWRQCIKDCTYYNDEYRILTDKNEIKWIHDIAEVKCDNGIAIKIVGTIQDITNLKLSERKIKRSDAILSQINSLVKVTDKNGSLTYASPSFKTVLGYEPDEMLGQGWWIKTTDNIKLANKLRDEVLDVVQNKKILHNKLSNRWIKTKDGKPKLFQWTCSKGLGDSLIFIGIDVTERKIAEKNSAQYWKIVENSLNEIFIFDADTLQFIEVNRGARKNIGYTSKELSKMTPFDIKPLFTKRKFNELLKPLKNGTQEKIIFNSEHQRKDGTTYKAEVDIQKSELKLKPVFIASVKDVTEQQKNEQIKQLIFNITKKSNESISFEELFNFTKIELGKLINTTNFFVALYDEKTKMISTPYMVDEFDDTNDFPKGKTLTGHVIDTKKAILTKDVIVKNSPNNHEVIGLGPQSKCWLGVPILIDNQALGAIVVQSYTDENAYNEDDVILLELIASSIGQIIRKTEDLEHIKLLNQALINTPAIVMITNKKGGIEFINASFTNALGYEFDEVIGKNPKFLNPTIKMKAFYVNVGKSIAKKGYWQDEIINIKKNGDLIRVSASIAPVKDEDDNLSHYIIVEEDITEKRKLERQFINAIIEAQDIEKQSFGEELHDSISQILSAESMYIDLLIDQNQDQNDGKTKFLTKIKELNSSAINETRNIAHGLMSNQLKQSGLLISVENICIDFSNKKSVEFKFVNDGVVEKDLSQEIKTNLFRVIQELSTNITRYSNATKALIHFSKLNKNNLKIIVKDNGIGMDYNKIKKESEGIGLQTVKRRITYLDGNFNLESSLNEGTCYTLEIPL